MFEALTALIERGGVWGLGALMLLENIFPPIPSEMIVPLAGFLAGQGKMPLWAVIASATFGSVIGAVFWYGIGRAIGRKRLLHLIDRFGLWATLTPQEANRAFNWFERYGHHTVIWGRMVPALRTLISIPAGVVAMPFGVFLLLTALGSLIWVSFLAGMGLVLAENYHRLSAWIDPISTGIIGLCVGVYVVRLVRLLLRRL